MRPHVDALERQFMNLSKEKREELREAIESMHDEARGVVDGGCPFKAIAFYVESMLIEYYSKGYQDGLECRDD